jgi:hypothetical protein
MSRQNKVNPGQYTSAGRLSPDDLGREMRRQRGKVQTAPGGDVKPPAWETTPPAPKISGRRTAAKTRPGRLKVAGAHAVIGVTRVTAGAAKAVTRAAAKVVGTSRRTGATASKKPAGAAKSSAKGSKTKPARGR